MTITMKLTSCIWVFWLLTALTSSAGVVEDWNATFLQAVRKETPPPCLVSRNLPIFHLAMHRSVRAAAKAGLPERAQEQAAFHAAALSFTLFFPSQPHLAEELRTKHAALMQVTAKDSGISLWRSLADAEVKRTFQERENDGSSTTVHYLPHEAPGQWRRTPPAFRPPELPHWGQMKPFMLGDVIPFRAPPPPALHSALYARDLNEVRELGGQKSTRRTEEQTLIARFWSDFSYTTSPAGHWNDIARALSLQRKLGIAESARLFALLDVTLADTCIAIWNTKYHYNYWRPVTAMQRADEDGNPATEAEKAWQPLLSTPPHPEYVSGHSGISGAAAEILSLYFGKDSVSFEVDSDTVKDIKRHFTSFEACAQEVARSRVYGGIHFSSAGREGLVLGKRIAERIWADFSD